MRTRSGPTLDNDIDDNDDDENGEGLLGNHWVLDILMN